MKRGVRGGRSLVVWLMVLVGCGGATTSPGVDTAAGDADVDTAAGDADAVDTFEDSAEVCTTLPLAGPATVMLANTNTPVTVTAAVGLDARVLVAWAASEQGTSRVQRVLLDATGATVATAAPVDTDASGIKHQPVACALSDGGYVIAWHVNTGVVSPDGALFQTFFRRYDADGAAVDPEAVRVLTEVPGDHSRAEIACDAGGGFVVAGKRLSARDGNDAYFQRFESDGAKWGDAVTVNSLTVGYREVRAVAVDAVGAVIVTWDESSSPGGTQTSLWRRFPAEGEPSAVHVYAARDGWAGFGVALATDPSGTALALSGVLGPTVHLLWFARPDAEPTSISLDVTDRFLQMVLAPLGCGRFAALWFADAGPSAETYVGSFGRDGFDADLNLGTGVDVPVFRPALAYGHGVLAAVWPQTRGTYQYAIQVALIGTAAE